MQNLQSLKKSLESTESLKTIVTTMKAHAATNIVQFESAAKASMRYRSILDMALYVLLSQEDEIITAQEKKEAYTLHIIFGSDYGLAGQFNERMANFVLEKIPKASDHRVIVIGEQLLNRVRDDLNIIDVGTLPLSQEGIFSVVQGLLFKIEGLLDKDPPFKGLLYYCNPLEESSCQEESDVFFPLDLKALSEKNIKWDSRSIPTYRMDGQDLLSDLMSQYFFLTLYRTFCYSLVSENMSRMESMSSASQNIDEKIERLNFMYRMKRQSDITAEINDVISGFKAIKKKDDHHP